MTADPLTQNRAPTGLPLVSRLIRMREGSLNMPTVKLTLRLLSWRLKGSSTDRLSDTHRFRNAIPCHLEEV